MLLALLFKREGTKSGTKEFLNITPVSPPAMLGYNSLALLLYSRYLARERNSLQWANGAICGHAILAAIDTIVPLVVPITDRSAKATAS